MIVSKDTIIAQLKDDLRKLKAENDSLYKQNNTMHTDINKIERYKKVLGAEQDVLNKAIEMLKDTSINLKYELSELQKNYEIALKQLQDSNAKNKSLLSSLEKLSTINENLKDSINNEKVIASIAKAELNSYDHRIKLLNDKCNRFEEHNKVLISDVVKGNEKYKELQVMFDLLTAASNSCSDTLTHAKTQHTLLVTANNEINIMKDNEINMLTEKVEMLQSLIDNKSYSNSNTNSNTTDEELKLPTNDTVTIGKTDDHPIVADSNIQLTSKKVTFLNKFIADDSPIKRNRNDYLINDDNNDQRNNIDKLSPSTSATATTIMTTSSCPLCFEDAYGLMTSCRNCSQKYHSNCAKKLKHFSKHFLCELCHNDDVDNK